MKVYCVLKLLSGDYKYFHDEGYYDDTQSYIMGISRDLSSAKSIMIQSVEEYGKSISSEDDPTWKNRNA